MSIEKVWIQNNELIIISNGDKSQEGSITYKACVLKGNIHSIRYHQFLEEYIPKFLV